MTCFSESVCSLYWIEEADIYSCSKEINRNSVEELKFVMNADMLISFVFRSHEK